MSLSPRSWFTNAPLAVCLALMLAFGACSKGGRPVQAKTVSFATADGGTVVADLYKAGERAVVLAHGKIFDKESWKDLATVLAQKEFTVLAIDFRGYGESLSGSKPEALYEDILGALAYLQGQGHQSISVIGGSMGGGAAAEAATRAAGGTIDRLILLSPVPIENPEDLDAKAILYVVSAEEPLRPRVQDQFDRAPSPKQIKVLPGAAHAQHIFETDQGEKLTVLILDSLAGAP